MLKIYRIVDNTNGNIYIGKTKQKYLCQRLTSHRYKGSCCSSSQIIKNGDYKIELIEETEDETRERYWVENTECINKQIPGRTRKEWFEYNRDKNLKRTKSRSEIVRPYEISWGGRKDYHNNNSEIGPG